MNDRTDSSPDRLNVLTQRLLCTAIVLCLLYVGKTILMPTVVAVILSFALMPLVRRLQHVGLNRTLSAVLVVFLTCVVLANVMLNMGTQLVRIAESLPQYEYNIRNKLASIDELTLGKLQVVLTKTEGIVGNLAQAEQHLQNSSERQKHTAHEAMTVRLEEKTPTPREVIGQAVGSIAHYVEITGLVLVVLIFILIDYEALRDRLIRLIGGRNLRETTVALNEAGIKLTRYFGAQIAVNALSGVVVGLCLHWLGVPEAMFWGALTAISRFIPYVGAWIAMATASLMAAAVVPEWSLALATIGLFVVVELSVSQIIEPKLYGHSTGLAPLSVVIGAIFWAALWGPIGLILGTPLTLLLVVAGRHVASLRFIELLLGDVPGLSTAERFYQRALSGDVQELALNLQRYLRKKTASEYCDHVLVPFISLAKEDFDQRAITDFEMKNLTQTIPSILRLLEQSTRKKSGRRAPPPLPRCSGEVRVISSEETVSDIHAKIVLALFKSNGVVATLTRPSELADAHPGPSTDVRMVIVVDSDLEGMTNVLAEDIRGYLDTLSGVKCFAFVPAMGLHPGRSLPNDFPSLLSSYREVQSVCDEFCSSKAPNA